MEWLLSYVDMQFVYLKGVVLFYVLDRFQGRTVSLIGYTLYKYIWKKKSNMAKVLPAMVKVSIIILSFIYSFPVAKLLLRSVWCNKKYAHGFVSPCFVYAILSVFIGLICFIWGKEEYEKKIAEQEINKMEQ